MRHIDTLSTIYGHIFHSKVIVWRKKRLKLGSILSRKFQITYKIIVCGEKTVKIGTLLSRKSSKDPSWLVMCSVYFRNKPPTGLPARFNAIQHKGDILPIRTCGDFYMSFVYRYCHEQSTCRIVPWIFRQSIILTIDNSTKRCVNMLHPNKFNHKRTVDLPTHNSFRHTKHIRNIWEGTEYLPEIAGVIQFLFEGLLDNILYFFLPLFITCSNWQPLRGTLMWSISSSWRMYPTCLVSSHKFILYPCIIICTILS